VSGFAVTSYNIPQEYSPNHVKDAVEEEQGHLAVEQRDELLGDAEPVLVLERVVWGVGALFEHVRGATGVQGLAHFFAVQVLFHPVVVRWESGGGPGVLPHVVKEHLWTWITHAWIYKGEGTC